MRPDGRRPDQLRTLEIIPHYQKHAEGSALIKLGDTWVLCAASVDNGVPPFLVGASVYSFAIRPDDLNVRRGIDLSKNFRGRPGSCNNRWFMRNDASAGVQRFGNEKLGGDVAFAYVFLKRDSDRIVIVRVHGGAEAAPYV